MIAAALDADGTISARQVSYKLKQLGLFVSRKKRSDTHFQLRDDPEDSAGCADNSDDEPLVSLKRKRSLLSFFLYLFLYEAGPKMRRLA